MSQLAGWPAIAAGKAFDAIADSYDEVFTRSVIGRAQRGIVWRVLAETFHAGDRLLELNCGTGEDALFLGRRGIAVEACDSSEQMIEVARRRKMTEPRSPVRFRRMATEEIRELRHELHHELPFDGVLSNFSGLNCVEDLEEVASNLSLLVRRGGHLVFCLSSRVCIWEIAWFAGRGEFAKGVRRLRGSATGRLGSNSVRVWYPSVKQIKRAFAPMFELLTVRAVGLLVPPSYAEFWARKHARLIAGLAKIDWAVGDWPVLWGLGDHVLLRFAKVGQ